MMISFGVSNEIGFQQEIFCNGTSKWNFAERLWCYEIARDVRAISGSMRVMNCQLWS